MMKDATGIYVEEMLICIINYLSLFPPEQSESLNEAEAYCKKARIMIKHFFDYE